MKRPRLLRAQRWAGRLVPLVAVMIFAGVSSAQQEPGKLRTNPFLRPALISSAPEPTQASGPVRSNAPPTRLRFALAAGPDSFVNVDGRTLRIGEEINGYRLEAVTADAAIFSKGNEMIELEMPHGDIRTKK